MKVRDVMHKGVNWARPHTLITDIGEIHAGA